MPPPAHCAQASLLSDPQTPPHKNHMGLGTAEVSAHSKGSVEGLVQGGLSTEASTEVAASTCS